LQADFRRQPLNMIPSAKNRPNLSGPGVEKHPHIPARRILDRIVLGGSDGAIESVAMTAALNGARVAFGTILIAGFAFAVAGAFSMFVSNFLSSRSELEALRTDISREKMEIETEPEEEKAELVALLSKEGYDQKEIDVIMSKLVKNKEMWLREQLRRELRVNVEDLEADSLSRPTAAGLTFLILALAVVSPYGFLTGVGPALAASVAISMFLLFVLSSRMFVRGIFRPKAGLESALIGAGAAALLYGLGLLVSNL
jgi:vacuolar iron transporter family protein